MDMLGSVKSWHAPEVPSLSDIPGLPAPSAESAVFCTSARGPVSGLLEDGRARLYVCGITPYDATHLGHASTYVAFDVLLRSWRDAGIDVVYVQNTTDIDDPLLERADATGVDWRELADSQIELFFGDMEALRVIPPEHYIGAVESIPDVVEAVEKLVDSGAAYALDNGDVYYRISTEVEPPFGSESNMSREEMLEIFPERGGDPDTPGKEDPLDPLLWRAAREGEPQWPGGKLGPGRPGWHIECAVIAGKYAGYPLTVQGGGSDLVFPHHEMCAAHAIALTDTPFADAYMHTGMVAYEGEKMSKSLGNLVLVSNLTAEGVDPMAIRLAILINHYRADWEYSDELLADAQRRLEEWRAAAQCGNASDPGKVVQAIREELADDLDTPNALSAVDDWAAARRTDAPADEGVEAVVAAVDALLGVKL